jgi:invasion protein IalB
LPATGEETDRDTAADSPWAKFCLPDACYVGKNRRSLCGLIADVTLVERKADTGKLLSIGLPPRVDPERAVRITIDKNEPVSHPVSRCDKLGCWADHEIGADLLTQLKRGHTIALEAVNRDGAPYSVTIPLSGFAEAYYGAGGPLPVMQEASPAEMDALRERDKRFAEERRARCGPSP